MSQQKLKTALTLLQWTLGLVILIEAVLFVMPSAAHEFSKTHMPGVVRYILGWGEIIGALLLLIPRTTTRGAWILFAVFVLAIAVHLIHGSYSVGNVVIYTAAAFVLAMPKNQAAEERPR